MRKYRVNWFLFILANLATVGVSLVWMHQLWAAVWPPKPDEPVWLRGIFIAASVMGQLIVAANAAVEKARDRTVPGKITKSQAPPVASILQLRVAFGIFSAFVGAVTVTVHVCTGKISVPEVVAYTIGVPFCFVFGMYLAQKAEETEAKPATMQPKVVTRFQEPVEPLPSQAVGLQRDTAERSTDDVQSVGARKR